MPSALSTSASSSSLSSSFSNSSYDSSYNSSYNSSYSNSTLNDISKTYSLYELDKRKIKVEDGDTLLHQGDTYRFYQMDTMESSVFDKGFNLGIKTLGKYITQQIGWQTNKSEITLKDFISQPYAKEATKFTKEFIKDAEKIYARESGRGYYGRKLGTFYNEKGENLNLELVREGLAITALPTNRYYNDTEEAEEYLEAMLDAYENKRGMFKGKKKIVTPSQYRNPKGEPRDFRDEIETYIRQEKVLKGLTNQGITNKQYLKTLASDYRSITLSGSAGASYHYGDAMHNLLMEQAGYRNLKKDLREVGASQSIMKANAKFLTGSDELTALETFATNMFDAGYETAGLGMLLNEKVFMPMGWGRTYKDEKGAIGSAAGFVGRILDEGYLYYASMTPDYVMIGQDINKGEGYSSFNSREGFFEATFSGTAAFALASANALAMFMVVSQPMEMIKAAAAKNYTEAVLRDVYSDNLKLDELDISSNIQNKLKKKFDLNSSTPPIPAIEDGKVSSTINKVGKFKKKVGSINRWARNQGATSGMLGNLSIEEDRAGGIPAAMMEQKYLMQTATGKPIAFFEYEATAENSKYLIRSLFATSVGLNRRKSDIVLNTVVVPFFKDYINPFNIAGVATVIDEDKNPINYHTLFNKSIDKLIGTIKQAPDLIFELREQFNFVEFELEENIYKKSPSGSYVLNKEKIREIKELDQLEKLTTFKKSTSKKYTAISSFEELMENHTRVTSELQKKTARTFERQEAIKKSIVDLEKRKVNSKIVDKMKQKVSDLEAEAYIYTAKRLRYQEQLRNYSSNFNISISRMGEGYKVNIAKHLQDLLELTPINPLKWGMFGRNLEDLDNTGRISQLFSFYELSKSIKNAITGNNALNRILSSARKTAIDPNLIVFQRNQEIPDFSNTPKVGFPNATTSVVYPFPTLDIEGSTSALPNFSNVDIYGLNTTTTTSTVGGIKEEVTNIYDSNKSKQKVVTRKQLDFVDEINSQFRHKISSLDEVVKTVTNYAKSELFGKGQLNIEKSNKKFQEFDKRTFQNEAVSFDYDTGTVKISLGGEAKNVDEMMNLLMDSSAQYTSDMSPITSKNITGEHLQKAIRQSGTENISGFIEEATEEILNSKKKVFNFRNNRLLGVGLIFGSLAANNIFQSTTGASIFSQTLLSLTGEDKDVAVEFQANRILPTGELLHSVTGLDPLVGNTIAELVTIGAAIGLGHTIAKNTATQGFVPYTFSREDIAKLVTTERYDLFKVSRIEEDGTEVLELMNQTEITDAKLQGRTYLKNKVTNNVQGTFSKPLKTIQLTAAADGTFTTKDFLRRIDTEVPIKTFVYASIGLITISAARNAIATTLNSLSDNLESESDNSNILNLGLSEAAFVYSTAALGVGGQIYANKISANSKNLRGYKGLLKSKGLKGKALRFALNKRAPVKLGIAASVASFSIINIKKHILDRDNNDPVTGGSYDPIIAGGIGLSLGLGITKSPTTALIAAAVGATGAHLFNKAGFRLTKTASRGEVNDTESTREVAELSHYTSYILDNLEDSSTFEVGVAVQAALRAKSINTVSREFGKRGEDVRVVARQAPFTVLQFFAAQKIENKGSGDVFESGLGKGAKSGTRHTFSVGMQTAPILGTSISIQLPFSYTVGKGIGGFSYNEDNNLFEFSKTVGKVVGTGALLLGGISGLFSLYGEVLDKVSQPAMKQHAKDFKSFSKGIDNVINFGYKGAAAANEVFYTTVGRTLGGLFGSDAVLLYKGVVEETNLQEQWVNTALRLSDAEVERIPESAFKNKVKAIRASTVNGAPFKVNAFTKIKKFGSTSKKLVVGALVSAALYKTGEAIASLRFQDVEENNRDISTTILNKENLVLGGLITVSMAGAFTNYFRDSYEFLDDVDKVTGITTRLVRYETPFSGSKVSLKGSKNYRAFKLLDKLQSPIHNYSSLLKRMPSKHSGKLLAAAMFASQMLVTSSNFGMFNFMDSSLVYKEDGAVATSGEYQQYEQNKLHQVAVSAGLTAMYAGVLFPVVKPKKSFLQNAVEYSMDYDVSRNNTVGLLRRRPDFLKKLTVINRDNEVMLAVRELQTTAAKYSFAVDEARELITGRDREILNVVDALGEETLHAIGNYSGKSLGVGSQEYKSYTKAVGKLNQFLTKDANEELLETFASLAKGKTMKRASTKVGTAFVALAMARMVVSFGMTLGEEKGKDALTKLYRKGREHGALGSQKPNGGRVGIEGLYAVASDVLRVFLGHEREDLLEVERGGVYGIQRSKSSTEGTRLVGNGSDFRNNVIAAKKIKELLVVDDSNPYFDLFIGGKTLREGDAGTYTSTYFQIQGAGYDVSTAAYSMSAKYHFNQYQSGKGISSKLTAKAMRDFYSGAIDATSLSVLIGNVTSQTPNKTRVRKYSRTMAKDAITDSSISRTLNLREEALEHIAYQSVDSLNSIANRQAISNIEQHYKDPSKVKKLLSLVAKGDFKATKEFIKFMGKGGEGNTLSTGRIKNVTFFARTGTGKSKGTVAEEDTSSIWKRETSIDFRNEVEKQQKGLIGSFITKSIFNPLASTGLLTWAPKPVTTLVAGAVGTALAIQVAIGFTRLEQSKSFVNDLNQLDEFWGISSSYESKFYADGNSFVTVGKQMEVVRDGSKSNKQLKRKARDGNAIAPAQYYDVGVAEIEAKHVHEFLNTDVEINSQTIKNRGLEDFWLNDDVIDISNTPNISNTTKTSTTVSMSVSKGVEDFWLDEYVKDFWLDEDIVNTNTLNTTTTSMSVSQGVEDFWLDKAAVNTNTLNSTTSISVSQGVEDFWLDDVIDTSSTPDISRTTKSSTRFSSSTNISVNKELEDFWLDKDVIDTSNTLDASSSSSTTKTIDTKTKTVNIKTNTVDGSKGIYSEAEDVFDPWTQDSPVEYKKIKGKRFVLTHEASGTTTRYQMSDAINFLTENKQTSAETIDDFLDTVERYGNSLANRNVIYDSSRRTTTTIKSALISDDSVDTIVRTVVSNIEGISLERAESNIYDLMGRVGSKEVITEYKKVVLERLGEVIDSYVDNFLNASDSSLLMKTYNVEGVEYFAFELMGDRVEKGGASVIGLNGEAIPVDNNPANIVKRKEVLKQLNTNQKELMRTIIEETVLSEIGGPESGLLINSELLEIGKHGDGIAETKYLMMRALEKLRSDPRFAQLLNSSGGLLKPEVVPKQQSIKAIINKMRGGRGANSVRKSVAVGSATDEFIDAMTDELLEDALQYNPSSFKIRGLDVAGKVLGTVFDTLELVTGGLIGLNIHGAYARMGKVRTSPFATQSDVALAEQDLGSAIISTTVGIGINFAMFSLSNYLIGAIGPAITTMALTNPIGLALMGVGAVAGIATLALGGSMAWKHGLGDAAHALAGRVGEFELVKSMKEKSYELTTSLERGVGKIASIPIKIYGKVGEAIGGRAGYDFATKLTSHSLGGAAFAGVLLAAAAVTPFVSVTLGLAGITLAGGLLVGGLIGITVPDLITDVSTKLLEDIKNIPLFSFLGAIVTDPYTRSKNKYIQKHAILYKDSPIEIGHAPELMNERWLAMLNASEDHTGAETASLLFGDVLVAKDYDRITTGWKKVRARGMLSNPPSIIDDFIRRELRVRAQLYSDQVVGAYVWSNMVENAENYKDVEANVNRSRKFKARMLERARKQALKNISLAYNSSHSPVVSASNVKNAAILVSQAEKVVEVYYNNPEQHSSNRHVTALEVKANKSRIKNYNLEQQEEVIQLAIADNTSRPSSQIKKVKFSANKDMPLEGSPDSVVITLNKEVDEMNDTVLSIHNSINENKEPSAEQYIQEVAFDLVQLETLT